MPAPSLPDRFAPRLRAVRVPSRRSRTTRVLGCTVNSASKGQAVRLVEDCGHPSSTERLQLGALLLLLAATACRQFLGRPTRLPRVSRRATRRVRAQSQSWRCAASRNTIRRHATLGGRTEAAHAGLSNHTNAVGPQPISILGDRIGITYGLQHCHPPKLSRLHKLCVSPPLL